MEYYSKWYKENRERLIPIRRKYNKEYLKRPDVIEKARMKNATPEIRLKRKLYKKTPSGRIANRKYRRGNQSIEWNRIKNRYGITKEEYQDMFLKQNGVCAICARPQSAKLHVDHCHTTKKVRGLLCGNCNRALGLMKDNIEFLGKAIIYLQ